MVASATMTPSAASMGPTAVDELVLAEAVQREDLVVRRQRLLAAHLRRAPE